MKERRTLLLLLGALALLLPVYAWTRVSSPPAGAPPAPAPADADPSARSLDDLRNAVRAQPTDAAARTALAARLARSGDLVGAQAHLEQAVALDPRLPEARHNLGLVHMNRAEGARAVEQFSRELELRPGDAAVHLTLGQAYLSLRRGSDSLRHLRLAAALRPGDAETLVWLARAAHFANDEKGAEAALKEAVAASAEPAYAWYLLGRLYVLQQRYGEALAAAESAIEARPDQPYYHLFLGQVRELQRDYPAAAAAYRRALEIDPGFVGGDAALGHVLALQRQYPAAIPHLKRALEADPERGGLHRDLAAAYRATGQADEARREFALARSFNITESTIEVYQTRTQLEPRSAAAWYALGRALARTGRAEEGRSALETALRLEPGHAAAGKLLAALKGRRDLGQAFPTE
jgi:protein O-GlcNAc transferase